MNRVKRCPVLYVGVAASALFLAQQASAASFTINGTNSSAESPAPGQTLNAGEAGVVEQGGFIRAPAGNGITGAENGVTVNNAGSVTGTGTLLSSGLSVMGESIVTNSGTAEGTFGIFAQGDDNTITNSGTANGGFGGINVEGSDNTITSSGTAIGGTYGILAVGTRNTMTNSGRAEGEIFGIYADGEGNTITNSGLIAGGLGAVSFNGSGNTLKLLEGSVLEGRVLLGDATNTLIIGKGLDTAVEFGGTPTIRTDGVPFVVAGSTVYAVNVSSFSVQDEMTSDLTRAVRGAVEGRLAQARLTGGGLSVAMNGMTIAAAADVSVASRNGLWLSGLAASRDQEQDGNVAAFETALAGAVGGFDGMVTDSTRAGLFGGFTSASLDAEDGALEDLDSGTWFGGAYLGHDWGHTFLDMTLTAGWSAFESRRRVANNIADGGIEHAGADYGGFLISPSVRIGTGMALGSGTFTPSLRLSYAGLFLEGYKESGPAAALDVDARSINILDVRGELAYGFAMGSLYNTLRIGIDGTFSNADDAEATLAGQALDIDVAEHNLVRGFIGYDADYALSDSASLTFAAEAGYDTTKAVTLQARAGLSWAF